jgi:hypothetical protein
VLKSSFAPEDLGRKLVTEMWRYPDGSRIIELSTKCAPAQMFEVVAERRAFVARRGIDHSGEQQTKAATALNYFAKHVPERG